MEITVAVLTDPRRPDLPEGISWTLVTDHGDAMTVQVTSEHDPKWLADHIPSYVPDSVSAGKFWYALLNRDEAVYDAVRSLVDGSKELSAAAQEPMLSRHGHRVTQVQQWCVDNGFPQVTSAWLDELFRDAAVVVL